MTEKKKNFSQAMNNGRKFLKIHFFLYEMHCTCIEKYLLYTSNNYILVSIIFEKFI